MGEAVTATALGQQGLQRQSLRDWQREALDQWLSLGRRGVVEAVTGTGKTAVGVAAAADALDRGKAVLVVVPGIDLLEQWHAALGKALPSARIGRRGGGSTDTFRNCDVLVTTVQSAIRKGAPVPNRGALLVADEVHRYGAMTFSRLLTDEYSDRLGLTATLERTDDGVQQYLEPYFERVIHGCDYERGHADGILAPVRVMLVAVPFSPRELIEYSEFDESAKKERQALIGKHGCAAEPFGDFMRDVIELSEGGGEKATWSARRYLFAFSRRRAVLAECEGKLDTLAEIGTVLAQGGRSIVFSETKNSSKAAAEVLLEKGVLAAPYTSDLSKTDRAELLGLFKSGAMTTLVAPKVLDEGVDVPEAEVGVILAGSKSRRQMIQRMGRVIRPKSDGRHASFLILYAKGSSEDPANGAHGTFLEQLTGIADEIVEVSQSEVAAQLAEWLGARDLDGGRRGLSDEAGTLARRVTAEAQSADDEQEEGPPSELAKTLRSVVESKQVGASDAVLACLSLLDRDATYLMIYRLGLAGCAPLPLLAVADTMGIGVDRASALEAAAMARLGESDVTEILAEVVEERI